MRYRVIGRVDKETVFMDFIECISGGDAYERGQGVVESNPHLTQVYVDLLPANISEIGYSSYHWDRVCGIMKCEQLSNCD